MSIESATTITSVLLLAIGLSGPIEAQQNVDAQQAVEAQQTQECTYKTGVEGVRACTKIINSHPPDEALADAYYNRGNHQRDLNNYAAAIADFSEAIKLIPDHDYALHNRAMILDWQGDHAGAIADFTKAIDINPIAGHFYNRARAYFHFGQFRLAADDYTVAVALWPREPLKGHAYAARCHVLAVRNANLEDARNDCDQALASNPNNPNFLAIRALLEIRLKLFDKAQSDLDAALASTPFRRSDDNKNPFLEITEADAMFLRGIVECHQGRMSECKSDIAAASQRSASILSAYSTIGITPEYK